MKQILLLFSLLMNIGTADKSVVNAINAGNLSIVKFLLENGVDPNFDACVKTSLSQSNLVIKPRLYY